MTKQEMLFFERVAFKLNQRPGLTPHEAMVMVTEDDKRIFESYLTMPDQKKREFERSFAEAVYQDIRQQHKEKPLPKIRRRKQL